jgi:hypothetical protein
MTDVAPEGRQMWRGKARPRRKSNAKVNDRYQQLIDGVLTVDVAQLAPGDLLVVQVVNGGFSGTPPKVIPWVMHDALRAAMARRTERQLGRQLPQVTEALIKIALDPKLNAQARVQAISLVLDRAIGKVPDKSESTINVTAKWEEAVKGGTILVDLETPPRIELTEEDEAEIVEAEIVEQKQITRQRTGLRL